MVRRGVRTSLHAGLLLAVLALVAWTSGQPFVFPSLGPSAFVLAFVGRGRRTRPRRVIGSHLVGAVAGFVAYSLLAAGVSLTPMPAGLSPDGIRLSGSAICSVVLTSWGMIATDTVHPPACATTLIVSLGLLSTPLQVGVIVVAVVVLVGVHAALLSVSDRVGYGSPAPDPE